MADFWSMCKQMKDFTGGRLIGLYGRGSSGKTTVSSSFPNPVFIIFDDQGLNSIKKDCPDIPFIDATGYTSKQLIELLDNIESINDGIDHTFVFSTFSVWIDNHPQSILKEKNKSHMNQDLWAEHNARVNSVIAKCAQIAKTGKRIILEFHERTSVIEGYEDELVPEIGVNAGPSVQKYLVGMLNYAFHTSIKQYTDQASGQTIPYYAVDINPMNPYYWIKGQGATEDTPMFIAVQKGTAYNQLKQYYSEL